MKILLSFTHSHVAPKLYDLLSSAEHKIFLEMSENVIYIYMLYSHQNCLVTNFLRIYFLCSTEKRKSDRFGGAWGE